jgi:soluble P-type ATPase
MLAISIPGFRNLQLEYLVLDYNGTLACDGVLIKGVRERLERLAQDLHIHVVTADTFGKARAELAGISCQLEVLSVSSQDQAKRVYVQRLGCERVVAIGNGRNDRLMLWASALGITITQQEGAAAGTLTAADVVVPTITDALDLLRNPLRLIATLRS